MYVQPTDGRTPYTGAKKPDFFVPEGYSGHAFDAPDEVPAPPAAQAEDAPTAHEEAAEPAADAETALTEQPKEAEAIPTGGLLGRVPLLSSLLPPRRGGRSGNSDLLFLGFLFFLLREDGENDLLPLLLLLLFWN